MARFESRPERADAESGGRKRTMMLDIYKPGQGRHTRTITFAVGALIGAAVAYYVSEQLRGTYVYLVYGIPVLIFVGVAAGMYWIVNRPRSADFMIAAEGEMKKVSWSSKKEIIGGTKVVIATTLILALLLLAVDLAFGLVFQYIGVLKVSSGT